MFSLLYFVTSSLVHFHSQPGHFFHVLGISFALDLNLLSGLVDLAQVFGREFDVDGAKVFFQAMQFRGAGDGYDPRLLRQQPGQRDLGGRCLLVRGDAGEQIDDGLVGAEGFGLEARQRAAEVALAISSVELILPVR